METEMEMQMATEALVCEQLAKCCNPIDSAAVGI